MDKSQLTTSRINFKNVYLQSTTALIQNEFKRVRGQCYLDHAGSTLYSEKQLSDIFDDFQKNYYGNPHAKNTPSNFTEDVIDQTRHVILQHFHTNSNEYTVIFTSGATAALKLVSESFCCNSYNDNDGTFAYLEDNHTSVLGMREYFNNTKSISTSEIPTIFNSAQFKLTENNVASCHSLFVYPGQSNFSGHKYPLSWIQMVQNGVLNHHITINQNNKWYCMIDAAAFVPSNDLNLSLFQPDFVSFSFHKIFGYPTGLGVLLVKNTSAEVLNKKYFGGGSVSMVLSNQKVHVLRKSLHERFEDGTLPYFSIISVRHGFNTFKRLNLSIESITQHTFNLANYVYKTLSSLHHSNGRPIAILYHPSNFASLNSQGGIVNFNLLKFTGKYIGFAEVQHIANLFGIHLRTGCSCNPGACQTLLQLSSDKVKRHFELGHVCGDENDLIDGYPTGSVRISFGYMSTKADADNFLNMVIDCFVQKPVLYKFSDGEVSKKGNNKIKLDVNNNNNGRKNNRIPVEKVNVKKMTYDSNGLVKDNILKIGKLKQIFIYPIKSCGYYEIEGDWELVSTGLKYDRQWMIVSSSGVAVTQKREVRLCLLKPILNVEKGTMDLEFEGNVFKSLPLNVSHIIKRDVSKCLSKVCGDKIEGWDCGDEVANWLDTIFNTEGLRLIQQCLDTDADARVSKDSSKSTISLSNQAQFLLVNHESVNYLLKKLKEKNFTQSAEDFIARFRPNLVVDLQKPFLENDLREIHIGDVKLTYVGHCNRCQMICVDQFTGKKSPEPLQILTELFEGKIKFGIYLSQHEFSSCTLIKPVDSILKIS